MEGRGEHDVHQHPPPELSLRGLRLQPAHDQHEIGELVLLGQQLPRVVVPHVLALISVEVLEQQQGGDQPSNIPVAVRLLEDGAVRAVMEDDDLEQAEAGGRRHERRQKQQGGDRRVRSEGQGT
jgi:hypothetical protein